MDITDFHNKHRGETCVVIGNGPSLDKTPMKELGSRYATFGSNFIYRKPFIPTYYACVDGEMCLAIDNRWPYEPESFIRAEFTDNRNDKDHSIYPIVANGFSVDINNFVVMGGTVTYVLLQIAFYMGFGTVLLVGVDHNYQSAGKLTPGSQFIAGKKDPDHFTPADGKPYFIPGKKFNAPEVQGTTRSYEIARDIYTQAKRRIINLTPGTKLNVFEKGTFEQWLTVP